MRKSATVTISDEGRDKGKTFVLTELSATDAEDWAMQAFLALAKSDIEIPEDIAEAGMAGIAQFGLKGLTGVKYTDAKPLFDALMECVQIRPDPKHPELVRSLVETDIEEWQTRLKLRMEVFKLHVSFFLPADVSNSTNPTPAEPASKTTKTFLPRSGRS